MAICECLPADSSMCGSIGSAGSSGTGPGALRHSRCLPSRVHRTVDPTEVGSPPSTSRTRRPGTGAAVASRASPTHTAMPSLSSTVNANLSPSGAQAGTLTDLPSGRSSGRIAPSVSDSTDSPVSRRVRCRPAIAGSTRTPASARYGRARVVTGGCIS